MSSVKGMAALVAAIPALIKRLPSPDDIVILYVNENGRVNASAVGGVLEFTLHPHERMMAQADAVYAIGVTFGVEREVVAHLAEQMPCADWLMVQDGIVHSVNTDNLEACADWRESEATADLVAAGWVVASGRAELEEETTMRDEPVTALDADILELLDDIGKRDAYIQAMARMPVEDLTLVVQAVVTAARRFPSAAAATTASIGWMLLGDGARANVWIDRALDLNAGYTMAQLFDSILRAGMSPGWVRETFSEMDLDEGSK